MTPEGRSSLKLALVGPPDCGKTAVVRHAGGEWGNGSVQSGEVAGSKIHRAELYWEHDSQVTPVRLISMAGWPEFQVVFELMLREADAIVLMVPASLNRLEESRRALSAVAAQAEQQEINFSDVPLVLQYNWREHYPDFYPEQLDEALGINLDRVTRVLSQEGEVTELDGIRKAMSLLFPAPAVATS